jgi:tetratricopeptide (TPR) repeat protein
MFHQLPELRASQRDAMSSAFRPRCIAVLAQARQAVATQNMPNYLCQLCGLLLFGLIAVAVPAAADSQNHQHDIGHIHFPVSCTPEAQTTFEYGVALVHSFWYDEAEQTFSSVIRVDPACAMAYWGIAMSLYHPVWFPPTPADLREGIAAIHKANSIGAKTQRERDYIGAIEVFYKDSDKVPHRQRALSWRNAMQRLSARYPEDHEAAIFYALALIATAPPAGKTYADQKQAAAILNRILPEQPDHPGIAHYLIHSYDSPQLAILALPAARAYAKIAPASPHALHMPSHIFTRLGLWDESIQSNLASAAAAKIQMAKTLPAATSQDQLHAMDYLAYAYLQTCQDEKAKRIVDEAESVSKIDQQVFQAAYAFAAIPARYALERRRWSAAAALQARPAWFPWMHFRHAEAITHFARALGSARTGNIAQARAEIEVITEIEQAIRQSQEDYDWAAQVEVQRLTAVAWLKHAEGNEESALRPMRAAADLEDSMQKHPVTPGPVLPARELLGELLMELDQPARALPEFEEVLRTSPNRFNAIYGAGRAAELCRDRNKATARYSQLLQLCGHADAQRLELQNAQAFLKARRN